MVHWENVLDKNIRKQKTSFKKHHSIIPIFHYSMYEAEIQASKKSFILSPALAGYKFRDVQFDYSCIMQSYYGESGLFSSLF